MKELLPIARSVVPGSLGLLAYGYGHTPIWCLIAGLFVALMVLSLIVTGIEESLKLRQEESAARREREPLYLPVPRKVPREKRRMGS